MEGEASRGLRSEISQKAEETMQTLLKHFHV